MTALPCCALTRAAHATLAGVAVAGLALAAALPLPAHAQSQSRGELLYTTHCGACHSAQMHWRDKKQVLDWASLRAQVRFWQGQAMLGWTEDDIQQVARYLNDTYYRMPPDANQPAQGTRLIGMLR
jgi:mono/diheme cytochrome c family protein